MVVLQRKSVLFGKFAIISAQNIVPGDFEPPPIC